MKAQPAPAQLEMLPHRRDLVLFGAEPNARREVVRTLAEILLAAAEATEHEEERDEAC